MKSGQVINQVVHKTQTISIVAYRQIHEYLCGAIFKYGMK